MRKVKLLALALVLMGLAVAPGAATAASGCDPIDPRACLLPWPNNHFTASQKGSATGLRLDLRASMFPRNTKGRPAFPSDLNRSDGFSPGPQIMTHVKGLDLARSGAVPVTDIGSYASRSQPVLLLDARTGRRQPIWAELDANPDGEPGSDGLLIVRPARNLAEGRRYVVVLRDLKDSAGKAIPSSPAFARIRDGRATGALAARGRELRSAFAVAARAGVKRSSIYLTWDFTVSSERGLTERALAMRNQSFAGLGDRDLADLKVAGRSPAFRVDKVTDYTEAENPNLMRRVEGTLTVPCYLSSANCAPGGTFRFERQPAGRFASIPRRNGSMSFPFYCAIPRAAEQSPARPVIYGHGLLGNPAESFGSGNQTFARLHNIAFCATREIGMSDEDVPNAIRLLGDMSLFASFPDRLQQGFLNQLMMGRAMIHPAGFTADAAFKGAGGQPLLDTRKLAFNGNSQGGILGPAITALAPDFTRSVYGVPGMNYSMLLPRSIDFDDYELIFKPAYSGRLERSMILGIIQTLWDRGEANGWALHATDDPPPGTPKHKALLEIVVGDHQVSQYSGEALARTLGASVRTPVFTPGRSDETVPFWGVRTGGPASGSWAVMFDSGPCRKASDQQPLECTGSSRAFRDAGGVGTPVPPAAPTAPRFGQDPHGIFDLARGEQAAAFFDGSFRDVCPAGVACRLSMWPY